MKNVNLLILITALQCVNLLAETQNEAKITETATKGDHKIMETQLQQKNLVEKKVLSNGMTVLVKVVRQIPKVSVQLWYKVGSKDERSGERGIAHLIEHMIFKGTNALSESDINVISKKLSGVINAFTSYDFTGYLFNFPSQNFKEAFPIMADCMENVSFKEDHLNSEMKAVIQELKMNRDNYTRSAIMELVASIFPDHPYHHPVIGYKQDLWTVHANDLRAFYKKHYLPNNATLVVVGDVEPNDVFALAQKYFGSIKPNPSYKKEEFYFNQDIVAKSVTLYRDVKQPVAIDMFVVPGVKYKDRHIFDVLALVLGIGKASRLYKLLVDELQLATSFSAGSWELFDYSLFYLSYEPKSENEIPEIERIIHEELEKIAHEGVQEHELVRAVKKAKMDYFKGLESIEQQANDMGLYYLATGDENYAFNYLNEPLDVLQEKVKNLVRDYCRPAVENTARILPIAESEKSWWQQLQEASDKEDAAILAARKRTSPVEKPRQAQNVKVNEAIKFDYPKAEKFVASNGLKILYAHNDTTPRIDLAIELKARSYYDPEDKQGLYSFVALMLQEGTKKYTAEQLADELESRGMTFGASPGMITLSMLSSDLEKGLELLQEILVNATFPEESIEKVRTQILAELKQFWDNPKVFSGQIIREAIYKNHPYHKNSLGTKEAIESITREDLVDFYKKYISPQGANLALVGDIKKYDIKKVIGNNISAWQGPEVKEIQFPSLEQQKPHDVDYFINRDQVVLAFAGLSVDRKNKEYDKLTLFDQIFGGGALNSMNSRLFTLREQSGLFYSIIGSLVAGASEQPGMTLVKTLVSLDRLQEAEKAIKNAIDHAADTVSQEEFEEARNAITNSLLNNFESNAAIAGSFLFLERYNFPQDYFDKRAQQLAQVKKDDMQRVVKSLLNTDKMVTFKIGRVEKKKE